MKLSTLLLNKKKTQLFLTTCHQRTPLHNSVDKILVDHSPSLIGKLNESGLIIKFIRARSWHEYLKLLWNHSRVTKEVKGNKILQELGLRVPEIHEVGYGVIPSIKHQFLGYYVMEDLKKSGFEELSYLFDNESKSDSQRNLIMSSVYNGLKIMRDNRIIFSDFHLENILANDKNEIVWIDTGITTYRKINNKKFIQKFNSSISKYGSRNKLNNNEISLFNTLLIKQ